MKDIHETARELGSLVARARCALPTLAQEVAKLAARNKISEDDAVTIFEAFREESMGTESVNGDLLADNSFKANTSKLRQVIKAAEANEAVPALLERITTLHANYPRDRRSLYDVFIDACRKQLTQTKPLSDAMIERLIRK